MEPGPVVTLAVLCAAFGICLGVLAGVAVRRRRPPAAELAESRRELAEVHHRLDELTRRLEAHPPPAVPADAAGSDEPEFVLTSLGRPGATGEVARRTGDVTPGRFASAAAAETLVTVLSFGHGLRRALSPENRNRIGFEMRREVRRSRKQRRRELKVARRELRAADRPPRSGVAEDAA